MAVIIFKPLEKCNANCIYCGVISKGQNKVMSEELLEKTFHRMNEYLLAQPEETVTVTWHGGEVCLLGVDYFRRAQAVQKEQCPSTSDRILHQVQTNLTLLTKEFVDVWKQMGITRVGTSFEPIEGIRGLGNKRDSRLYNERFLRGAAIAEEHGLSWGVIYVVNRRSLEQPLDIFRYLANLSVRSEMLFNKIHIFGEGPTELNVTEDEFADFLGAIFPVWWKERRRYPHVRPFSRYVDWYTTTNKRALVCESSGKCANNWIYIGPTGETSQCGRSADFGITDYGNITDRTLAEILHDQQRDVFSRRQQVLPQGECAGCRFWGICHGGCQLEAYRETGDFLSKSPRCRSLKRFLTKYFEPITGLKRNFPYHL